jgi:uncharacterized iron-regulated membrane protein
MVRSAFRSFRRLFFWLHLIAGVTAAAVVLVMSVTGVALTYQRQMQYWADTRHYRAMPAADQSRLPLDTLVADVEAALARETPVKITSVAYRSRPDLPAALSAGNRTYYANPYTGALYGEGTGQRMRAFFSAMVNWHRWLAMSGETRPTGRAITGAANLVFLFIVLSGLYLWWPSALTWGRLRQILWFRRGLPGKARDFNWHNTLGFWSAIPLAIVVYSGVVISYPWASNGVYRLMGEEPPARAAGPAPPATGESRPETTRPAPRPGHVPSATRSLDASFALARAHDPAWRILTVRLATGPAPAVFTIDRGDGGQPHLRGTLTLDRATGDVVSWAPFSDQSPGRQLRSILRFAHTGEAGGLPGQTAAGLVSAAAVVLVYTGLALSVRRLLAWWRRRREPQALMKAV